MVADFFLKQCFSRKLKQDLFLFFTVECKRITLAVWAVFQVVDDHQGFLAVKEEPWLAPGEARGVRGGAAGRVPVLGPEKRLLVGLRPDELVSPACGRDRAHTPSDSAHRRVLPLPTTAGRGWEQTRCQRDLNQEWRRRGC